MELIPLGHGFAKLVVNASSTTYFYRAKMIPNDILKMIPDIEHPQESDQFTCDMAGVV